MLVVFINSSLNFNSNFSSFTSNFVEIVKPNSFYSINSQLNYGDRGVMVARKLVELLAWVRFPPFAFTNK